MMEFNDIIRNAASLPTTEIAADVNKALTANGCVVLTAPPGAGKSTLLPLTVMAGFLPSDGKILMLEPRRLAARQVAERMADMLSEHTGGSVGYRVRFENRVSESTRIEVITEGILTRMLIADPLLEGVSVVIFDEFHERSINSDLAFALTRQCQQILRPDLKIVIMSATIDTSSICTSLNAPLIECRGKMFPVETRYATTDISPADIPTAVASAINKAHSQHEGDILAFLPGQADIAQCERLLADKLSPTAVFLSTAICRRSSKGGLWRHRAKASARLCLQRLSQRHRLRLKAYALWSTRDIAGNWSTIPGRDLATLRRCA